jgi:hypothetical protein
MQLKIINQTIQATLLVAAIALIGSLFLHRMPQGIALFAGALWGSVNLFFLKHVMHHLLLRNGEKHLKLSLLFCLKWPLLYLAGYGLLKTTYLPTLYLLGGFSLLLGMILILGLKEWFAS